MTAVGHRRLRQHDRPVELRACPDRSTSARRLRDHRGRRRARPRGPGTTPSPGAPTSTARSPARPAPPTPITSPPRPRGRRRRRLHGAWPWRTPASTRRQSATSTPTAPRRPSTTSAEAEAIDKVFGAPAPPVTSIKGVTGHALGARGRHRGGRVAPQHRAPPASRPPPATSSPTPRSTSTSCRAGGPALGAGTGRCPTRSASAATTAAW